MLCVYSMLVFNYELPNKFCGHLKILFFSGIMWEENMEQLHSKVQECNQLSQTVKKSRCNCMELVYSVRQNISFQLALVGSTAAWRQTFIQEIGAVRFRSDFLWGSLAPSVIIPRLLAFDLKKKRFFLSSLWTTFLKLHFWSDCEETRIERYLKFCVWLRHGKTQRMGYILFKNI